eukprot:scaffold673415_cov62-Prasinocladus_malaysianus.AAC.1
MRGISIWSKTDSHTPARVGPIRSYGFAFPSSTKCFALVYLKAKMAGKGMKHYDLPGAINRFCYRGSQRQLDNTVCHSRPG